jgi:hypothetical protein
MDEIDNIYDSDDDIDESDLDFHYETSDDEFDRLFGLGSNSKDTGTKAKAVQKRSKALQRVFVDGTKRGQQTQQMFNILNSIVNKTTKGLRGMAHH